jgi:hypothetical protein
MANYWWETHTVLSIVSLELLKVIFSACMPQIDVKLSDMNQLSVLDPDAGYSYEDELVRSSQSCTSKA